MAHKSFQILQIKRWKKAAQEKNQSYCPREATKNKARTQIIIRILRVVGNLKILTRKVATILAYPNQKLWSIKNWQRLTILGPTISEMSSIWIKLSIFPRTYKQIKILSLKSQATRNLRWCHRPQNTSNSLLVQSNEVKTSSTMLRAVVDATPQAVFIRARITKKTIKQRVDSITQMQEAKKRSWLGMTQPRLHTFCQHHRGLTLIGESRWNNNRRKPQLRPLMPSLYKYSTHLKI